MFTQLDRSSDFSHDQSSSDKRSTPSVPSVLRKAKHRRRNYDEVLRIIQQEFRRRAKVDEKLLALTLQNLEHIRAIRRDIAFFIRENRRQSRRL